MLHHRDLGGAGRPPLVLLHGLLGSSRNWQTAGTDLSADFHVHAPDLRNHGRSPHADGMGYAELAGEVLAWLDALGLGAVNLLGHSMGGKVAMRLACRHPERVRSLVVVDIAPRDYFWPGHRESFAAMNELDLATLTSRGDAEARLGTRVTDWALRKFLATNLECDAAGRWRWQINLPALTRGLPEVERNPLEPADQFAGPVRFITGGRSPYVEAGDHAAIRTHFPAADIVTLPDCGHNPHVESRAAFVAAARAALARS
jgi:pimeloyl-ACP methyl ester carboxylesterase